MLYNVEELEEIIEVYIDQEFNKMDKELNSLHSSSCCGTTEKNWSDQWEPQIW
jgi:hypothetical protein